MKFKTPGDTEISLKLLQIKEANLFILDIKKYFSFRCLQCLIFLFLVKYTNLNKKRYHKIITKL